MNPVKPVFRSGISELIANRFSCRSFEDRELEDKKRMTMSDFLSTLTMPDHPSIRLTLIHKKEILERLQKEVNKVNKRLGQVEQIKRFRLVCDTWSPESGDLSPTLKLKRKELYAKYDHILKEIYSVGDKN